jgi:hypothetical protein
MNVYIFVSSYRLILWKLFYLYTSMCRAHNINTKRLIHLNYIKIFEKLLSVMLASILTEMTHAFSLIFIEMTTQCLKVSTPSFQTIFWNYIQEFRWKDIGLLL